MATLTIRDLPDDVYAALPALAQAAGFRSTEAWVRHLITSAVAAPIVKRRYTLKAVGPDAARAHVRRDLLEGDRYGIAGRGLSNANQGQADAYRQAINLVERNAPGDRERALAILGAAFEDVFETA